MPQFLLSKCGGLHLAVWKHSLEFWVKRKRKEKRGLGVPVISPWAATLAIRVQNTLAGKTQIAI